MKFLNVGGCNKAIPVPAHYDGWDHNLLDIVANEGVDLVCDSRSMAQFLPAGQFDAVYCSHNLEHYYRHDVTKVLAGFKHVLNDEGFIEIRVPNMQVVFERLVKGGKDIEDVMYESPAGPIRAVDMIYGLSSFIEGSGNDFMCHKNGFTPKSLGEILYFNGFEHIFVGAHDLDLLAFAFKQKPSDSQVELLNLKHQEGAST